MKKIGIVCLALACALGSLANTAYAQNTRTWSYQGNGFTGYFHANPSDRSQWFERVSNGSVYQFLMVQHGADYIDLFDGSRGVTVRLALNACYIHHSGTGGRFIHLYNRSGALTPLASLLPPQVPDVTFPPLPGPGPEGPLPGPGPFGPSPGPGPEGPAPFPGPGGLLPSPGPGGPLPSPGPEGPVTGATTPFLPQPPSGRVVIIDD
jgi:hypothetical protein